MRLSLKALELRKQLVSGQLPERRPQLAASVGWVLNFLLGLTMAAATILDGCGPFGIAAVAQAGPGLGGFMCTLGASLGYLLSFGFEKGIQYVAAAVLVFTAVYVCQELKVSKKAWFLPALAMAFTLLCGCLGVMDGRNASEMYVAIAAETLLAGAGTYFFREALRLKTRETEAAELRHELSVIILLACLMLALCRLQVVGVSVGRLLALLVVMTAAFQGGSVCGAATGAALGLAMDAAAGGVPFYCAAYSLTGLVSGLLSKHSRTAFAIIAILTNAVSVVWTWRSGAHEQLLYEAFAASVVFMLLPSGVLNYVGAFLRPPQMNAGESGLRRYTAKRISAMGEAFRDLYDTVDAELAPGSNDEDLSKIFDRASESVCSKCKNKQVCWTKNYMDTLSVFNDLTPIINARGLIARKDISARFTDACQHPDALVEAINAELRGRMYRRQFQSRLRENRMAAYGQYREVSELLKDVSQELQNAYGPDVLAQRRLVRYLSGMDIDADASVFRDRSGRLHIIIESARLNLLTRNSEYLDSLSGVVGARLCRPKTAGDGEGRLVLLEAEPLSVSVGIASMKKKGESVSGDRGTYFKTDRGRLCIILSDGMGSGNEAARESVSAVRILERFLRTGVEPQTAMKMLNDMMLLKNGEEWGFATADLMCIDLFTGETGFYKYGAAPSYVRSGKNVRRVKSESLAAGLTAGDCSLPDMVKMRLKPGNLALIASDGVVAGNNDAWLRTMLCDYEGSDTKMLARETLQAALKQNGCTDDMTVLAVRIENRE